MQAVRWLLVATLVLAVSGSARAVTPDELAALARAGLSDEVLLALIESTGVDRAVDATRSLALKRAGVSDRVIAAAVRASHEAPAVAAIADPVADVRCEPCDSNVAVIGGHSPVAVVQREVYYVPWIWAVPVGPAHPRPPGPYLSGHKGVGRFINDGVANRTSGRR
jgi:hypothetical protein